MAEQETKKKEDEKKKSLGGGIPLGGSTGSGASALSTLGAGSGSVGGLLSSGILATKTGVVALALIGTTVAGGIGVVGYRMLTGDSASASHPKNRGNDLNSLFNARPKAVADSVDAAKPVSGGQSDSLSFLAQANGGAGTDEKKPEEVKADAPSASINPVVNNTKPVSNAPGVGGDPAKMPSQLSGKKIGELTKDVGAAGGSSGAHAGGIAGASPQSLLASARMARAQGFGGKSAQAILSSHRGPRAPSGFGAGKQLMAVNRDSKIGGNFRATGGTIDGSAASTLGGENSIGAGMPNAGKPGAADKPGSPTPQREDTSGTTPTPENVPGADMTPWKKAIDMAKMALLGALALIMLAAYYIDTKTGLEPTDGPKRIAAAFAIYGALVLGAAVAVIGAMMMFGPYHQLALALPLFVAGALVATSAYELLVMNNMGPTWGKASMDAKNNYWVYASIVAGLVALASLFLKPKVIHSGDRGYDSKNSHGWGYYQIRSHDMQVVNFFDNKSNLEA